MVTMRGTVLLLFIVALSSQGKVYCVLLINVVEFLQDTFNGVFSSKQNIQTQSGSVINRVIEPTPNSKYYQVKIGDSVAYSTVQNVLNSASKEDEIILHYNKDQQIIDIDYKVLDTTNHPVTTVPSKVEMKTRIVHKNAVLAKS
jgi:hypothetical protein